MASEITEILIAQLRNRDAKGLEKYGVSLDRTDLTPEEWLQHLTEELLDGAGYAQSLLRDMKRLRQRVTELEAALSQVQAVALTFPPAMTTSPRRGRGRPRKSPAEASSKNGVKAKRVYRYYKGTLPENPLVAPVKRGRGRPRKNPLAAATSDRKGESHAG